MNNKTNKAEKEGKLKEGKFYEYSRIPGKIRSRWRLLLEVIGGY